jgi:basic amino acid/polyamine antiporter, APA family
MTARGDAEIATTMTESQAGKMGFWMTSALVVGTIIGGAIFMLPVTLAPLGVNAVIGWVVSGIGALCIVLGLARISQSGGEGIQANIEREFGATSGFLATWSFWVSNWVAQASVAIATASALSFIGPQFGGPSSVVPVAIGCVVVVTVVNAIGVRASGGLSVVTVAIKILPLLAVIWLFAERGASGGAYEAFAPVPVNFANVATATALTFFALTGFEAATAPVCKIRDASRTIPRALLLGTAFVTLLYLAAGTGIQMLLPAKVVAASPAPFADALVSRWGHGVASFSALAIAIAAFGCLNCLTLGTGELGYSMALRGDLPSVMARTRGANTPVMAQIVGSVLAALLILANSSRATANLYTFIILLSTAAVIVVYLAGVLAAWKSSSTLAARAVFVVAILFIAFAIYGTGMEADLWCLVLLVAGLAIRAVMRRLNSRGGSSPLVEASPAALPE